MCMEYWREELEGGLFVFVFFGCGITGFWYTPTYGTSGLDGTTAL